MQHFSADTIISLKKFTFLFFPSEYMNKPPSKVAHNQPRPFFSVLPTDPNPAKISIPVP